MHIRRSSVLALSAISLASFAAALPHTAYAQDAQTSADAGGATDGASETIAAQDIIVTGSARTQRRFDVAYAINSLSQEDVLRIAPKSFADLLGTVPGIQVEATGGEVQNVTRVRGIPTDRGYLIFQQDGLPLYHEIDGPFFNSGEGMHRFDLMTERTEIVRGGPAPIYASSAAAIANNITASGGEEPRGKAQITVGDTELYRLDLMQTGKLADRTYFAIGGFYRRHEEGYRDSGFPSDKGGQIRANIKRETDNGFVKISAMYVNDHNTFYLPIPISDPRNPTVSLDPFIDYHRGTLNSPALRDVNIRFRRGVGGVESYNRDLADGRHMRFFNAGVQYEGDLDGWLVSAKVGFTKGKSSFDAFYSTTNPSDANAFAAGTNLTNARTAFGPGVARLGYTLAGTSTVYDPYVDSGLVVSGQYRMSESDFYSAQGDFSVTRKIETGLGTHDLRVGAYTAFWGNDLLQAYQDMLIEVRSQPRLLDLNAYSATGAVLGSVTQNGVLRYTTTLNQGEGDARMIAFYANDTWDVTEGLRIDAGIRHERYGYNGYAIPSVGPVNLGDRTTLADDQTRGLPNTVLRQELNPTATNWTVGASYDFSSNLGVYGRISNLEVPPQLGVVTSINPTIVKTKARQIEAGIKASFGRNYLYATGFYTKFDPFNASFAAFNPDTGRNDQVLPFLGEATVKGVEIDGQIAPVRWFTLTGSVTRQEPEYNNLVNNSGADPSAVEGNQIIREAKFFGNLRPAFNFAVGEAELELFGRFDWVGKRYVDLFNRTAMPGYETLGAGVAVNYADWRLQVVGDNLTNAKGLTEGNTRTDQFAGQGTTEAIYGRPLFGRNFRLILSRSW